MEHCALWVLRCLLFQLRHHFCYRQQEGPCFPSAQTVLATWVTWILNRIFCFQKTNYWKPFFLLLFFFFLHVIQSLMKSRLLSGWQRNIHCWVITTMTLHHLKKLYNNFQTSSFLHQRWQTMIVQIPNFIHVSRKKSFKLISCRLHSPDFLHSLFS